MLSPPKRELRGLFARVAHAFASPARLEILDLLAQSEKTVEGLAQAAGLTVKNASAHLQVLRGAGLVETRRDGTFVHYRLADGAVHDVLRSVERLAERQLAEVRELVRDHYESDDALEAIGAEELLDRMRSDDVVLLDVRPADEYAAGHIAGALSVPIGELKRRLETIPRDREIVAYCRGRYCVFSLDAVTVLRARGYAARRLIEGVPEWRERGLPIAAGAAHGGDA